MINQQLIIIIIIINHNNDNVDFDDDNNADNKLPLADDKSHNAKILRKLQATAETGKCRSDRPSKNKHYKLTFEALKQLKLEKTADHTENESEKIKKPIE